MAGLIEARAAIARPAGLRSPEALRAARDSVLVTLGGQVERLLGLLTTLALRWGLEPDRLGVYTGLRLYLDNTNRSSLGVALGAVQEIPILRAAGREAEAKRLADVAHTTNTLTCAVYAAGLLAWAGIRAPLVAGSPLAAEWTWGLTAIAGLAILKRRQDFLIALLRAHQEFRLTTRLAVLDALLSAALTAAGLWLAGFWGLLGAVGGLLVFNIAYLQRHHPLRLGWCWDLAAAARLMRVGLPILANTAAFGALLSIDRALILWRVPDGERVLGLYSIALIGTNWSLDVAGRIVGVLYTYFQGTLGRTGDESEVARQAALAAESQAPLLAAGGAAMYLIGPAVLGALMPRYVDGLPALRPLMPGMLLLGMAWPARQSLIAVGRTWRLFGATVLGLGATVAAGVIGAERFGIVGVAAAMSVGYAFVYGFTSAAALVPHLGRRGWARHQARILAVSSWFALGAVAASGAPRLLENPALDLAARAIALAAWSVPVLWLWGERHGWASMWIGRGG